MNIIWNADKYASDFSFVYKYGEDVLRLLDLPAGASVLALGCGSGALSKALAERGYRVTAADASPEQLRKARELNPGIEYIQADATNFTLPKPVDGVFSNAVFHWIDSEKQADMLSCIYRALKPGGQLVFEMGGKGNNQLIHAALTEKFTERGLTYNIGKYFASIGEYAQKLETAGFKVVYATLFDRPTELHGEHGAADWIDMFAGNAFEGMSSKLKREIELAAEERLRPALYRSGKWYADYVRLRMKAVKPL